MLGSLGTDGDLLRLFRICFISPQFWPLSLNLLLVLLSVFYC